MALAVSRMFNTNTLNTGAQILNFIYTVDLCFFIGWELSGRVLDSRPRAAGSTLMVITALCP